MDIKKTLKIKAEYSLVVLHIQDCFEIYHTIQDY